MKTLKEIFNIHGTDKAEKHRYDIVYDSCFSDKREEEVNILEIGTFRGASTAAFREYFPKGNIYTIDIFKRVPQDQILALQLNRVHSLKANSMDGALPDLIKQEWGEDIKFDFIIDDGAHYPSANRMTFNNTIQFLKEDGAYFIEDFWPLHLMSPQELRHEWLTKQPNEYNMKDQSELMQLLGKYKVEHFDHRGITRQPDSYVLKVEHK